MAYGYIYMTENTINGYKYIGQHKWFKDTIDQSYFGSGTLLKEAIKRDGKDNFTCKVIEWCESQKELDDREKYWIEYYNATNSFNFYNIIEGGRYFSEGNNKAQIRHAKKRTPELIKLVLTVYRWHGVRTKEDVARDVSYFTNGRIKSVGWVTDIWYANEYRDITGAVKIHKPSKLSKYSRDTITKITIMLEEKNPDGTRKYTDSEIAEATKTPTKYVSRIRRKNRNVITTGFGTKTEAGNKMDLFLGESPKVPEEKSLIQRFWSFCKSLISK